MLLVASKNASPEPKMVARSSHLAAGVPHLISMSPQALGGRDPPPRRSVRGGAQSYSPESVARVPALGGGGLAYEPRSLSLRMRRRRAFSLMNPSASR